MVEETETPENTRLFRLIDKGESCESILDFIENSNSEKYSVYHEEDGYRFNYKKVNLNYFVFESPLMRASRNLRLDVMQLLISKGSDVNLKSNYYSERETALSYLLKKKFYFATNICKRSHPEDCIKLLLDNGADFNFYLEKKTYYLEFINYVYEYKLSLKEYDYLPKVMLYDKTLIEKYKELIKKFDL